LDDPPTLVMQSSQECAIDRQQEQELALVREQEEQEHPSQQLASVQAQPSQHLASVQVPEPEPERVWALAAPPQPASACHDPQFL
jgi:hypothetical protein